MKDQCEGRINGRRCGRLARGKGYESKLCASKPGWSLVVKHRFCVRCGCLFLGVTRKIELLLSGAQ